jgi:putative spermidine/putrescine transport system permease protein
MNLTLSPLARTLLRVALVIGLAFIYVPLAIVLINSFNADRTFAWPPSAWTVEWWARAWESTGARDALWTSVKAGLGATAIALLLGSMISFAVGLPVFGRNSVSSSRC